MHDKEPILTAVCHENRGTVERCVYALDLTPENLRLFWEKAKQFNYLFDQEVRGDFKKFCALLLSNGEGGVQPNGLFWVVDDFVGIFYMTRIRPGLDAEVHYTFFDRIQNGRVTLTREMLKYGFQKYAFRRLSVEIPLFASEHTFHFVGALGFRPEGKRRKGIWHNDAWFDVKLYGILREELLENAYVAPTYTEKKVLNGTTA